MLQLPILLNIEVALQVLIAQEVHQGQVVDEERHMVKLTTTMTITFRQDAIKTLIDKNMIYLQGVKTVDVIMRRHLNHDLAEKMNRVRMISLLKIIIIGDLQGLIMSVRLHPHPNLIIDKRVSLYTNIGHAKGRIAKSAKHAFYTMTKSGLDNVVHKMMIT